MAQSVQEDIGAYLDRLLCEGQVKLEITGGIRTWRLLPSLRHQKLIDRIRTTILPVTEAGLAAGVITSVMRTSNFLMDH